MSAEDLEAAAVSLAVAEAQRHLAEQGATLTRLGEQGMRLVTVATAVAAFFGFQLGAADLALDLAGWFTVGSFALVMISVLIIEWPRSWCFNLSAKALLDESWLERDVSVSRYRRDYAEVLEDAADLNSKAMAVSFWAYRSGLTALGIQTASLVVALSV
jgi:hypothetical protein